MYVVILILLALVALMAVQNTPAIIVHFLLWRFHMPLAVVVLLSLLIGAIVGMLYVQISARREIKKRDEALSTAEGERNKALMELKLMKDEQERERHRSRNAQDATQNTTQDAARQIDNTIRQIEEEHKA